MGSIRLALCGDVMTGRGIDQVLPHPGNPVLHEPVVQDAREYVQLAENASGPIPRPVDFAYIWGDARRDMLGADVRIVNLETSVTKCGDFWPEKDIHYRMHPGNVGCLTAAGINCCCLANNHVLDWGLGGLEETLATLDGARLHHAGAGRDAAEAAAPAILEVENKGRVLIVSVGSATSGIPRDWQAGEHQPGVHLLSDLSPATADTIMQEINRDRQVEDVVVVSVHWGGNWGYDVPADQIDFAHRLIDGGADVVHGHSSHHPKAIEVYGGRPILYGCGDFLNDYEGIRGYEAFRGDLTLLYVVDFDPVDRRLNGMELLPFHIRRFRLERAVETETAWLGDLFKQHGTRFGKGMVKRGPSSLELFWD